MFLTLFLGVALLGSIASAAPSSRSISGSDPTAHVRNGTYAGVRNTHYGQDFFLGIPYAQQPVGNLRFALPASLNETWEGRRDAKAYGDICVGYGTDSIWNPMSEACLTLNVIRDSSVEQGSNLPVGVWIHGGGFVMGSGADERYNMSAIVANAHRIGKPFIAVTLNYRLSTWGFLSSNQTASAGITNIGLRDQRLALHWIQENIAAFGGDPSKVTIWGESAGGISVGTHLRAYGGRDDGLFRGAIMQSGGSVTIGASNATEDQRFYNEIVSKTGCSHAGDTLQCLRTVPFEELNALFNGTGGDPAYDFSTPVVDGDLIKDRGSVQLDKHAFVKVPIIAGSNTDEGTSFGPAGINTTRQWYEYLTNGTSGIKPPPSLATQILNLYPDDPTQGIPAFLGPVRIPSKGLQWRRTSAYAGDFSMHANRRRQCEAWAESKTPAYCYRFNTRGNDVEYLDGVAHFTEVAFVFNNITGLGYHYGKPFANLTEGERGRYLGLSKAVASMWAGSIYDLDPNVDFDLDHGGAGAGEVIWEGYEVGKPVDLVFDANVTGFVALEEDTWRKVGIEFINKNAGAFGR